MRALLVVLLLLGGLAFAADRGAEALAEDRVARLVAERGGLAGEPAVEIGGFPFLTQAVGGRYDDVRISLSGADLGQPEGTRADVSLQGVQVALSDILAGSVQDVPVERVDGTATLSYELLADQLGPGTTVTRDGGGLRVQRSVEVAGVRVPLAATGTVSLDGDTVVVDVDEATGAGVDVPGYLVDQVSDALDLRYRIPPLPFGLHVTGVAPADDGVRVRVEAADTVLRG
ncbi:LmeA family phospholipid-binding protein [Geodermatophilus sp. URMC 61]|uniref:LmeA family phospholipid-binding protein n=1 Tax=Geodermatophilus sp. URMC 61 TaxID=3423411 RepID=UPI00406C7C3C